MAAISLSPGNVPAQHSNQYWAPVVANHFPPTSPFIQSRDLGYSLLPQGVQFSPPPRAPLLSHSSLTRQRSGGAGGDYTLLPQTPKLERKRSKKAAREVGSSRYKVIPTTNASRRERNERRKSHGDKHRGNMSRGHCSFLFP